MERIISIKEVENIKGPSVYAGEGAGMANMLAVLGGYGGYDGYHIKTDKQDILVLIDNGQSCCESWGYLDSFEDPAEFEGAELRSVSIVDTAYNKASDPGDCYEGGAVFVNFETDRGLFQLTVYNSHNGYYGHGVIVRSEQTGTISTGV